MGPSVVTQTESNTQLEKLPRKPDLRIPPRPTSCPRSLASLHTGWLYLSVCVFFTEIAADSNVLNNNWIKIERANVDFLKKMVAWWSNANSHRMSNNGWINKSKTTMILKLRGEKCLRLHLLKWSSASNEMHFLKRETTAVSKALHQRSCKAVRQKISAAIMV